MRLSVETWFVAWLCMACACGDEQSGEDALGSEASTAESDDSDTEPGSEGSGGSEGSDGLEPAPDGLTFDTFADGFLRNWCRGCHSSALQGPSRYGAPEGVDFNTHEDALLWRERILARATGEDATMPPVGGPNEEQRALLHEWLQAGAP